MPNYVRFLIFDTIFCQYFGRDSMIALRLLMPTLTSDAIESALGAVIERANSTGALCHEETIGKLKLIYAHRRSLISYHRRLCIFCESSCSQSQA